MAKHSLVSIHAPVRGATFLLGYTLEYGSVSIHAPVRGATCRARIHAFVYLSFNPRAREGRDLPGAKRRKDCLCFNPRAREGRDIETIHTLHQEELFQSTRP